VYDPYADLRTLADVPRFINESHSRAGGGTPGAPSAVADPGQLMAHALKIAGGEGLTRAELEQLFVGLGQVGFNRGIAALQTMERVVQSREPRPNSAGLVQWQVVFRHS
jgi:hypothetical protein